MKSLRRKGGNAGRFECKIVIRLGLALTVVSGKDIGGVPMMDSTDKIGAGPGAKHIGQNGAPNRRGFGNGFVATFIVSLILATVWPGFVNGPPRGPTLGAAFAAFIEYHLGYMPLIGSILYGLGITACRDTRAILRIPARIVLFFAGAWGIFVACETVLRTGRI